jgi:16S rRNA C967 or C1407 C5-methylase (RsmB/RsmF family)
LVKKVAGGIAMGNYRKRLKMAAAGLTTRNEAAKRQAQKLLNELAEADKRKRLNKKRRDEKRREEKWRDEKWRQVLAEQESERLREMLKPANPLDYYTTGVRQVVSGGLSSLGKKR